MTTSRLLDIIGWIGTVLIVAGYGLYSTGIVPDVMVYHLANLCGSLCVIAISYYRRIWQPVVINGFFALFALIALIRYYL